MKQSHEHAQRTWITLVAKLGALASVLALIVLVTLNTDQRWQELATSAPPGALEPAQT